MTTRRALTLSALLFAGASLYAIAIYSSLPETVPTHWNLEGKIDGYGPKWTAFLFGPGLIALMTLLMVVLPRVSPRKFEPEPLGVFNYLMVLVNGFMLGMQVITTQAALGASFPVDRVIMVAVFLLFSVIGNVMGKMKRNFWMGVRTPWTLADERVWTITHRAAARLWTIGGVAGAFAAVVGAPPVLLVGMLGAMGLWPIVHSYLVYRSEVVGG